MPNMDGTAASRDPRIPIKMAPPEDTQKAAYRPNFISSYFLAGLRIPCEITAAAFVFSSSANKPIWGPH